MRLRALFSSSSRVFSPPSAKAVHEALASIVEPQQISGLSITDHRISFIIETTATLAPTLEAACKSALSHLATPEQIHIICTNPPSASSHSTTARREMKSNEGSMSELGLSLSHSATARHEVRGVRGGGTPPENNSRAAPLKPARYNTNPIPHVGRIIAIASGKGGVGKSSLTVLIAHALAARGQSVAIVDADIHGPSIPRMLGLAPTPPEVKDGLMIPAFAHGIMANSIGLVAGETAAIWRGPMVSKALVQLLRGTNWESLKNSSLSENRRDRAAAPFASQTNKHGGTECQRGGVNREAREGGEPSLAPSESNASHENNADGHVSQGETTLLIDLPPGTGDIQLSLMQAVPVSAAILVTTPQEVARIDAHKAATMFAKLNIPILGVVENMSYLETPSGERITPFGTGGGQILADSFGVPLLATLPLDPALGQALDEGKAPNAHSHAMLAAVLNAITARA